VNMVVVVVKSLENCRKSVLDFMPNRYHHPLSDITVISGTRFLCAFFKAHRPFETQL
jgi:hypothetical protein